MRGLLLVLSLAGGMVAPMRAQLAPPPTWRWVTDAPALLSTAPGRSSDSSFTFVQMPPGWHVTMGPGAILYEPRYFAEGNYSMETEIFHFPGSSGEEYGFLVGGRELDGKGARYAAFVIRGDGSAAAWESVGGTRRSLVPWRRVEAVLPNTGSEIVRNVLKLTVTPREAVLRANGLEVLVLPLEGMTLDGAFGFRVGRGVNLHITRLDVTQRLAPARP